MSDRPPHHPTTLDQDLLEARAPRRGADDGQRLDRIEAEVRHGFETLADARRGVRLGEDGRGLA